MLQSMRSGLFSKLFMSLLLLGGVGLAVMDWQGVYTGGNVGSNDVAKIGSDRIGVQEFARTVEQNLRGANISPYDAFQGGLIHQLLSQQISGRMLGLAASEAGLRIGQEQLAGQLRTIIQPLKSEGMSSREALTRLAQISGQSQKQLIAELQRREAVRLLIEPLGMATAIPSASLAADLARINGEQRKISTVVLPNNRFTKIKPASETDLATHYEIIKKRFTISERRSFELVLLDAAELAKNTKIEDEAVTAYYNENKETYALQPKRTIEQVLIADKEKAEKLVVPEGGSLKEAAEKAGLGKDYQKPTDYAADALPEELSKPVFAAGENTLLPPIQSPLGWHVIKVIGQKGESHKSLDEVRDQIVTQLQQDDVSQEMEDLANQLDDALAGGASLTEATKGLPVKLTALENLTDRADSDKTFLPDLAEADRQAVLKTAFALDEGETAPLFPLSDGRYATVYIGNITPARTPPLKDVEKEVAESWLKTEKQRLNLLEAGDFQNELKAGKTTLEDIAKKTGQSLKTITVKNNGTPPAPLTPETVDRAFEAQAGETVPITEVDGVVLARVDRISYPAPTDIGAEDVKAVEKAETEKFQEKSYDAMMMDIQNSGRVMLNQTLLQQTFGRKPPEEGDAPQ